MKEDFLEEVPQGRRNLCGGKGGEKGTPREEMSKARQPGPEGLGLSGNVAAHDRARRTRKTVPAC